MGSDGTALMTLNMLVAFERALWVRFATLYLANGLLTIEDWPEFLRIHELEQWEWFEQRYRPTVN